MRLVEVSFKRPVESAIWPHNRLDGSRSAPSAASRRADHGKSRRSFFKRARAKRRESLCRPQPVRRRSRLLYDSLHLADLAVACACAMGREDAWNHFVQGIPSRHVSRRGAIDPGGGAREIADSLYASCSASRKETASANRSSVTSTDAAVFRPGSARSSRSDIIDRHRETRRSSHFQTKRVAASLRAALKTEIDPDRARYVAAMRAALAGVHRGPRPARSPPPRLLLCAGDDARRGSASSPASTRPRSRASCRGTRRVIREDVERRLQAISTASRPPRLGSASHRDRERCRQPRPWAVARSRLARRLVRRSLSEGGYLDGGRSQEFTTLQSFQG